MNDRNTIIENILKYVYYELTENEINLKRKWLKGQPNSYIYKIYFDELKPIMEANKLLKEIQYDCNCEDYNSFNHKYN